MGESFSSPEVLHFPSDTTEIRKACMAKFMTTKEASEKWNIIERRINVLCKEGRILGAYKENKRWIIPSDAVKPADKRLKGEVCISSSEKKVVAKNYLIRYIFLVEKIFSTWKPY